MSDEMVKVPRWILREYLKLAEIRAEVLRKELHDIREAIHPVRVALGDFGDPSPREPATKD